MCDHVNEFSTYLFDTDADSERVNRTFNENFLLLISADYDWLK